MHAQEGKGPGGHRHDPPAREDLRARQHQELPARPPVHAPQGRLCEALRGRASGPDALIEHPGAAVTVSRTPMSNNPPKVATIPPSGRAMSAFEARELERLRAKIATLDVI